MILSKIALQGFKSFARKIELRFDGKITAVVGPNGCGKTNIVDAIRWGLGEQKTTVLRTDRMENVIFGGARSSKPLGLAEVSVTFDNSKHILPIDYSEVMITRRLFRSGDSEYLLNKNPVRLKDINDLIMDTGIGADAYSVIELKMVEDILSDKAEDRRKLLEEAAGVTKYKHRLKAAIRKLNATQNDLLRVNDIIQEVDRTVNSLKRQVQRARRYRVLEEETRELEIRSSRQLLAQYDSKLKPLTMEMSDLQRKKEGRTTEITKEEADLEALQTKMLEEEKALIQIRETLNETVERIHQRESDIRVSKERISSSRDRISRAEIEIQELKKRLNEQKSHLEVTHQEREGLQVKITSTQRIFNNKKKELDVFQQGLNLKRLDLNQQKKEIIGCLEEINRLRTDETQSRTRIDNFQGRLERLDEEDEEYRKIQSKGQEALSATEQHLKNLQKKKHAILQNRDKTASEIETLRNTQESAKESFYRDQSELELYQGRLSFLRNIVENHEGLLDGAKRILEFNPKGLLGVLADQIDTDDKNRLAIETGLGESARYLIFKQTENAFTALEQLKKRGGGKVAMVGLDHIQKTPQKTVRPSLPIKDAIVGWADDQVTCKSVLRPAVQSLLGDLLIVKNLSAAKELLPLLDEGFFRVVTLSGELVTGWGVLQTGSSEGEEVGMVGRQKRIKELESQIQKLKEVIIRSGKQLDELKTRFTEITVENEKIQDQLTEVTRELEVVGKERNKANFELESAEKGLQNNIEERQRLLAEIEKGKVSLEDLRPKMEALKEKREQLEKVSGQIQADVERLEEEEREMEEEVHRHNLSVVRLSGEAKNLDLEIQRSGGLIKEIEETIQHRIEEIKKTGETITVLKHETDNNEKLLIHDYKEKDEREKQQDKQEQTYRELKEEMGVRDKEVRQVRRDREQASEQIHQMQMKISDLEHQAASLKTRIWESYEIHLEKSPLQEEIDLDKAESKIVDLKRRMKGLGAVNLMALEEYEQENNRLTFLRQQRDDLMSARETLKETILKINKTARKRFEDVFDEVRKNFKETFTRFFQGGEADLRIAEDEDPLEAQVEIVARPAGKHFRDLSLLSGGERALTAISLLFALYLVKPSPFCILDEIDAPLDDANVRRFTRVLNEFAEKTQFIIVTHNKMTMRAAKTLYGVTMEEEGVSKIVSVKFEEKEPEEAVSQN